MTKRRVIITIDGLAASGKSAISKLLAERLGYVHLSSGAIYRALGLLIYRSGADPADLPTVMRLLEENTIGLVEHGRSGSKVLLNGADPGEQLYEPEVSNATSISSAHPEVRAKLLPLQQECFPERGLVAEGRDMGTVVFPDADIKFFIQAAADIRAQRRLSQLYGQNSAAQDVKSLKEKIEMEINERDRRDSKRAVSPTVAAEGAIIVDNSAKTLTEVVENMYHFVSDLGSSPIGNSDKEGKKLV
ncbi:MAG: (d)CMP kinase [Deltaproteobacteria bacterium]|nr:(d)CMP kinase [Deltaproteobacteria bacterium]